MNRLKETEKEEMRAFMLAMLLPHRTLGYIGAGTGSLIIQVVIAGLVGGLFALKVYWRRIKAFFTRNKETAPVEDEAQVD